MEINSVGIKEAKANLSKLLRLVQGGNEIILTDRGRPVGKIVPIQSDITLEERIRRLEDMGILEPKPTQQSLRIPKPICIPSGLAQKILQEDRENANR